MRKNGKRIDWTPQAESLLKKRVAEGIATDEIAKELGRTESSIAQRRRRLGIRLRKPSTRKSWTDAEVAELQRLIDDRHTSAKIAEMLGRTKYSVDHKISDLGLNRPSAVAISEKNPLHVAEIIKFKMAGWTLARISKVYDVTEARISAVLCKNGFKKFYWARTKHRKGYQRWSEVEFWLLRKYLKKGYSLERLQSEFPHRSLAAIRKKRTDMTRYWLTPTERAERQRQAEAYRNRTHFYIREPLQSETETIGDRWALKSISKSITLSPSTQPFLRGQRESEASANALPTV